MVWKHVVKLAIPCLQFASCAAEKQASSNPVFIYIWRHAEKQWKLEVFIKKKNKILPHLYFSENVKLKKTTLHTYRDVTRYVSYICICVCVRAVGLGWWSFFVFTQVNSHWFCFTAFAPQVALDIIFSVNQPNKRSDCHFHQDATV